MVINTLNMLLSSLKQETSTTPKDESYPTTIPTRIVETGATCQECGKHLKRNCDMNKHMKRHTKPYGCTFTGCDKVFGSKNDWKRHENSQHFQGEFFKCQQPHHGERFNKCAFMTQHQTDMEVHLINTHYLSSDAAKGQVAISHVGRNHQNRFWCGFCGEVVRLESNGVGAWDERFNHIDKHFMKENRRVEEWVDPETYKTKRQMYEEGDKRRRERTNNADLNGLGAHVGSIASLKRGGESLEQEETERKQQKRSGASIIITCVSPITHVVYHNRN
jgi:hypothetical protein